MERAIDKCEIDKKIKPLLALWDIIGKVGVKLPLRNEIRDFRVSRIRALTLLEDTYQVPEDYHVDKSRRKFIHLSGSVIEQIIISFDHKTAKYIMEYESELADEILQTEDGITFIRNTAVTDELIRWILQFGQGAKVLNPSHLKDKIKKELENSLNKYK